MAKLRNINVEHVCDADDGIMSLYSVGNRTSIGKKPIIFIRGHAGKYTVNTKKILDNAPKDFKLVKQHEGFWYDDTIHHPFIAEFAYKDTMEQHIRDYNKDEITTEAFAQSILSMINQLGLKDVDMVGASVGGSVAMLTTKETAIDRISVVSPVIPYSLLADIDTLKKVKNKSVLNFILYLVSIIYMDQDYGFVQDMGSKFKNAEYTKSLIDARKIFINAGAVDKVKSKKFVNMILEYGIVKSAETISKITGKLSDGAIVTDSDYYDRLGVQYEITDDNYHVYCDQAEYLLKRAYQNLDKIHTLSSTAPTKTLRLH